MPTRYGIGFGSSAIGARLAFICLLLIILLTILCYNLQLINIGFRNMDTQDGNIGDNGRVINDASTGTDPILALANRARRRIRNNADRTLYLRQNNIFVQDIDALLDRKEETNSAEMATGSATFADQIFDLITLDFERIDSDDQANALVFRSSSCDIVTGMNAATDMFTVAMVRPERAEDFNKLLSDMVPDDIAPSRQNAFKYALVAGALLRKASSLPGDRLEELRDAQIAALDFCHGKDPLVLALSSCDEIVTDGLLQEYHESLEPFPRAEQRELRECYFLLGARGVIWKQLFRHTLDSCIDAAHDDDCIIDPAWYAQILVSANGSMVIDKAMSEIWKNAPAITEGLQEFFEACDQQEAHISAADDERAKEAPLQSPGSQGANSFLDYLRNIVSGIIVLMRSFLPTKSHHGSPSIGALADKDQTLSSPEMHEESGAASYGPSSVMSGAGIVAEQKPNVTDEELSNTTKRHDVIPPGI